MKRMAFRPRMVDPSHIAKVDVESGCAMPRNLIALFTPDTIVVTSQRIIRYWPSGFMGFHKDIEDYHYEDVANFKIMSKSLVLDNLPKGSMISI